MTFTSAIELHLVNADYASKSLMEQFNVAIHRADVLTRYSLDQDGPEALYDALMADEYPKTASELRQVGEQLGYFRNGKPN